MNRKFLYLPVEVKSRELDAKLLLAFAAIKSGWEVVLGREDVLNELVDDFPPGIYLAKNINSDKDSFIKKIYDKGFFIFFSDEESGLTQNDYSAFLDQRISLNNIDKVYHAFLWSEEQKKVFHEKYNSLDLKFSNSGSPRLDLMTRYFNEGEDVGALYYKKKYSNYILFSSNFTINNLYGEKVFKKKLLQTGSEKSKIFQWFDYKKNIYGLYLELIKSLSALYPDINFVIRPHPGEALTSWGELSELGNVFIDKSYSLISAIKNSKLVVHHGCTASVESYLQGVPSVYYDPVVEEKYVSKLFKEISLYSTKKEHFFEMLNDVLGDVNGGAHYDCGLKKIGLHSDGMCYERFVCFFNECDKNNAFLKGVDFNYKKSLLRSFVFNPVSSFKAVLRNYLPWFHPVGRILEEKCPRIESSDILAFPYFEKLNVEMKRVRCTEVTKNLMHIRKM